MDETTEQIKTVTAGEIYWTIKPVSDIICFSAGTRPKPVKPWCGKIKIDTVASGRRYPRLCMFDPKTGVIDFHGNASTYVKPGDLFRTEEEAQKQFKLVTQ